jgi:hypothetical protein
MTMLTLSLGYFCFVLPSSISSWRDMKMSGIVSLEPLDAMNVEINRKMTMLEKVDLMINSDKESNVVLINQGKEMTQEEAIQTCMSEINTLEASGIISALSEDIKEAMPSAEPLFYISSDDPSKSMILWVVTIWYGNGTYIVHLDDESGKIMNIISKEHMRMDVNEADINVTEIMIQKLGNYLGLEFEMDHSEKADELPKYLGYDLRVFIPITIKEGEKQIQCLFYMYKDNFNFQYGY